MCKSAARVAWTAALAWTAAACLAASAAQATAAQLAPEGTSIPLPQQLAEPRDASRHQFRSFLWGELNLVALYSPAEARVDSTPRPQRSSAGLEWAGVLRGSRPLARLFGGRVEELRFDLHPLVIYDPIDDAVELVFHDAWLQLDFAGERSGKLRIGHFLVPFGQNPVLEPRGFFLLPLSAADLGFKRDWGLSYQTSVGERSLEIGLTAGSGLGLHLRHDRRLITARLGTPTNRDFQYGVSALYGRVPEIRAEDLLSRQPVDRWRLGGDLLYKLGVYALLQGELAVGRDGAGPVFGYKLEGSYVLPRHQDLEAKLQLSSWFNDLDRRDSDDTTVILGLSYSLSSIATLSAYYLEDLRRQGAPADDRIFLQMHVFFRADSRRGR